MSKVASKDSSCLAYTPEQIRCNKPPDVEERCTIHHVQLQRLIQAYTNAAKIVDSLDRMNPRPSAINVHKFSDRTDFENKRKLVRDFYQAIREEKLGREIHVQRFFGKADQTHKKRMKLLDNRLHQVLATLENLETKGYEVLHGKDPEYRAWVQEFQKAPITSAAGFPKQRFNISARLLEAAPTSGASIRIASEESEDDELVAKVLKEEQQPFLRKHWSLVDFDEFRKSNPGRGERELQVHFHTRRQLFRRIILHDRILALHAEGKGDFREFFLGLSAADFERLDQSIEMMRDGLMWCRYALIEALALFPSSGSNSEISELKEGVQVLGGPVFNHQQGVKMTGESWFYLLIIMRQPANVENRMMRLFQSFREMQQYFSLAMIGLAPVPDRCKQIPAARSYLCLCGYIVDELISSHLPFSGPIPTERAPMAGSTRNIKWAQAQNRAYLFGVVQLEEESDGFPQKFLQELRSRPDLFVVITRSETDPGTEVDQFGGTPDETFWNMRGRNFYAPYSSPSEPPESDTPWENFRMAKDILFTPERSKRAVGSPKSLPSMVGYIDKLATRDGEGMLFKHKSFPAKYVVVLDAEPNRSGLELTASTVWAALRARGVVDGWDITEDEINRASEQILKAKLADQTLWLPDDLREKALKPGTRF